MQREEKQLEMFLDTSLTKLKDLKNAIGSMIRKIGKFIISQKYLILNIFF